MDIRAPDQQPDSLREQLIASVTHMLKPNRRQLTAGNHQEDR
jgi:hypothetical protein